MADIIDRIGETLSDTTITAQVKAQYVADDKVSMLDISVTTDKGIITLEGMVDSQAAIVRAMEIAKNTSGVKQVINHLAVRM